MGLGVWLWILGVVWVVLGFVYWDCYNIVVGGFVVRVGLFWVFCLWGGWVWVGVWWFWFLLDVWCIAL